MRNIEVLDVRSTESALMINSCDVSIEGLGQKSMEREQNHQNRNNLQLFDLRGRYIMAKT